LTEHGERGPVLVVNPPGFTTATRRPSIVVPSNGAEAIRQAADRFGARWLIVESNIPSLVDVWRSRASLPGFRYVNDWTDGMGTPVRLLERDPTSNTGPRSLPHD
jgi:hypothetical protein